MIYETTTISLPVRVQKSNSHLDDESSDDISDDDDDEYDTTEVSSFSCCAIRALGNVSSYDYILITNRGLNFIYLITLKERCAIISASVWYLYDGALHCFHCNRRVMTKKKLRRQR